MGGSRATYFLVGLFVIAMVAGTLVAVARLSGWTAAKDDYFTAFRNVSGLNAGSTVFYEGFPIGRVTGVSRFEPAEINAMQLNPRQSWFRVDFEVDRGWTIPQSSTANIVAAGLLAAPSLTILEAKDGWSSRGQAVTVGGYVPSGDRTSIFSQAESLAETFQSLAMALQQTLEGRVNPTIDEARALVARLATGLDPVLDETERLIVTLNAAAEDLRQVVRPENRAKVEGMIDTLNAAAADVRRLARSLNQTSGEIEAMVVNNRADVDRAVGSLRFFLDTLARDVNAINRNLDATARNLNEFSRRIRQNPGLLLGGAEPRNGRPMGDGR